MPTGSCSCRFIRYTTSDLPSRLVNCHCVECRKQSGGPYQTWAHFHPSQVTYLADPPETRSSSAIAVRSFCPRCGSSLSMAYTAFPDVVAIAAGTLDSLDSSGDDGSKEIPKPGLHIFLKEKADWFEVPNDGLERYEAHFLS